MEETIIFGGSFNPIHIGHIHLAKYILSQENVHEVWLMISPHNPLKKTDALLEEKSRYLLACKALKNESHIKASDFEFHLPRPSYTWKTLCSLRKAYPQRCFSLLIGADNWLNFNKWANPEKIIKNHKIYIYPRKGYEIPPRSLPYQVCYLAAAPLFPFSSSDIRQAIDEKKDINGMIPQNIAKAVQELYANFIKQ